MKLPFSGLLDNEGIAIRVVSLMNEILEPVSIMMCMSVPSTMPLMCAVQMSFMFVAGQCSVSGWLVSVVVIRTVSCGAGSETADVCPAASASGSFPDDGCDDLGRHHVDHSEDPGLDAEVWGLCTPRR